MLLGAQSIWATDYLQGSWNEYASGNAFVDNFAKISLSASTNYWVKIDKSGELRTANTSITGNVSGYDFRNNSGDYFKMTSSVAGDYSFIITSWNTTSGYWSPILTIMYPGASYTRPMAKDAWGTICLPYAVTAANAAAANMKFYSIYGVDSKSTPTKLYLVEETGALVAGQPYIIQATAANPSVTYETTAAAGTNNAGLYGTHGLVTVNGSDDDDKIYVISGGYVQRANSSCTVTENRAYIKWNDVTERGVLSSAPGIREMPLAPENATDIQSIEANETAVKFFENGKLLIRKDGVVYDMTGRIVK